MNKSIDGIIDPKEYFSLIDKDFIGELSLISPDTELQTDFKVAYLILFFQLSLEDKSEKNILLGDLFISILTKRLICRDRDLLAKIMLTISSCHCENILWKIKCYKRELLKSMEGVVTGGSRNYK